MSFVLNQRSVIWKYQQNKQVDDMTNTKKPMWYKLGLEGKMTEQVMSLTYLGIIITSSKDCEITNGNKKSGAERNIDIELSARYYMEK